MATNKERIASTKSDGLQCCEKCQFRNRGMFPLCDEQTRRICSVKYREGFLRGVAWHKRQKKNTK